MRLARFSRLRCPLVGARSPGRRLLPGRRRPPLRARRPGPRRQRRPVPVNLGIGLRADRLAVSPSQDLLCPLIQLGTLAQQASIAYPQVEQVLFQTAAWCGHRVSRRLLGGAEHQAGCAHGRGDRHRPSAMPLET